MWREEILSEDLPLEISPLEVKARLDAGEKLVLLDVRQAFEYRICSVEGAMLIPMNEIPGRLEEVEHLANENRLMVLCHHGMRSLSVVSWLRQQGLNSCQSVRGGIDLWSTEVDPGVPRY